MQMRQWLQLRLCPNVVVKAREGDAQVAASHAGDRKFHINSSFPNTEPASPCSGFPPLAL